MKTQQHGFGVLGIISIIGVISIIGLSGWLVWQKSSDKNATAATTTKSTKTVEAHNAATPETYTVPSGYQLYTNADYGFKFAYPKDWGELLKTQSDTDPTIKAETPEKSYTNSYVGGKLSVRIANANTFQQMAAYHAYDVKPVRSGTEYNWVISSKSDGITTGPEVGDSYDPQPILAFQKDTLRVYQFNLGHACGEWAALVFPTGPNFVSITVPAFCDMNVEDTNQEKSDKALADYKATITSIAKTIRQGSETE